jgi:hypothetical protein
MRDIQTVTGYFYAVYAIAAVILSAYVITLVVAARKAKARLDAAGGSRSPGQAQ